MTVLIFKLLKPLATPLGWSVVLWGAAGLIYWRWSRLWGTRCGAAGIALLLFFGNAPVAKFLLGSLEDDYPNLEPGACPRADAIVVLGGGVTYPPAPARKSIEVADGFDRLLQYIGFFLRVGPVREPVLVKIAGQADAAA